VVLVQERDTKIANNHDTEERRMDTSKTVTALQNEIKKLKERDAINTLQLEKLSKNHQTQFPQDSDDESSNCSSYEERIIAANTVYNDDSTFFLDKEPFIISNKLLIIHSLSEQSLEQSSTTASCITALTNQLDIANNEIANLTYYKKKDRKNNDKDSDNIIGSSTTASSTTTSGIVDQHEDEHSEDNKHKALNDDKDMIKSDIPRSIEVDVSSKCERLEQQIAYLERQLDNMSLVSSSRKSQTSSKHSSLSHGNNSIFSDDDNHLINEEGNSAIAIDYDRSK